MTATGTHPPFDRELGAALAAIAEQLPGSVTPDLIPLLREGNEALAVSDDDLRRGGAIEFEERSIPGPAGAPEISVLICRPA